MWYRCGIIVVALRIVEMLSLYREVENAFLFIQILFWL